MQNLNPIILFDGLCNLCNATVQFILRWENKENINFANLQSDFGKKKLLKHSLPTEDFDTIVLLEGENIYFRSNAILGILSYLKFPWPLLKIFYSIPPSIRDSLYTWIANNRYSWFGRSEQCILPNSNLESRFLT